MTWSVLARWLIVSAVIAGAVYWLQSSLGAAGEIRGYKRGYEAAMRVAGAETLQLLAERRAEALQAQARAADESRAREEAIQARADAAAADAQAAAVRAGLDRAHLAERVRNGEARLRVLARQLSETADGESAATVSAGALRAALERLAGAAADAETVNARYGQCLKILEAMNG